MIVYVEVQSWEANATIFIRSFWRFIVAINVS